MKKITVKIMSLKGLAIPEIKLIP
ncbi:hypothetical protein CY0110_16202 [Crocosphaera chwakensis CCY0110]|uniref:Uncharacterized protein n=1 Tax=Crocosphaera chwakensis CCY0110 TaxID=391612 RepID=A3IHS2_9CHRO|nr:hypothetical protein CY0110_16202 [Crocosphaera chwakensis CCY0110]